MATSLTRSEARALGRLRVRDTSTVNPGISDANWNLLIEQARQFYAALHPEQFTRNLGTFPCTQSAISFQATISAGNVEWRAITSAFLQDDSGTPTLYTPLRFSESLEDILKLQADDNTEATPDRLLILRSNGSDTVLDIYLYPIPDLTYDIQLWGYFEPALLTGDSDPLLFGFHGSRTVAMIAALTAARILGRPEDFVRGIAEELPDRVATRAIEDARYTRPLSHPGKTRT